MTRINSLYGSQTSPVVLCVQNCVISTRNTSHSGSQPSSVFFACKIPTFGSELQVSMGPSPHLWFLHAKQRLRTIITSLYWSQTSTFDLCIQNRDFRTRITSRYWSQPSYVVLCNHNGDIMTRINSLYGYRPSPVVF